MGSKYFGVPLFSYEELRKALVLYTNTLVCTPHREKRRERKKEKTRIRYSQ
jgi:hypothetical protein